MTICRPAFLENRGMENEWKRTSLSRRGVISSTGLLVRQTRPECVLPATRSARTHAKDPVLGSRRAAPLGDGPQNKQLQRHRRMGPGWSLAGGSCEDRKVVREDAGRAGMRSPSSPLTSRRTHRGTLTGWQTGLEAEKPGHVASTAFTTGSLNAGPLASVPAPPNPLQPREPRSL